MSTAHDKDQFARVLAVISIAVSGYFAWKQSTLSERVFAQSQENLELSTMLDLNAPIHLEPLHEMEVAGVPNAKAPSLLPRITVRYKALLSNRSLIAVSIKSHQVACQTRNGMWSIQLKPSLFTSDGAVIKAGTSIEAGKSLQLVIQSTCEMSLDAFSLLKRQPMQSLSDADSILANRDMNLFGQAPKIQRMPDGLQVRSFTAEGYPLMSVRIVTTRDADFSWNVHWNGNDIF